MLYVIKTGDTLSGIAARFGSTVGAIMESNVICNPTFRALLVKKDLVAMCKCMILFNLPVADKQAICQGSVLMKYG
jgi:hypothetical protein